ncbi:MAG: MBL fold metallo-hydrolase [Fibrobacteria bacterium]|nr:MBL fold metallo-hydrolase [Fibrobacteria bacterium]
MIIKTLSVGPIQANCYIIACEQTKKAAIIDPGDEAERIMDMVTSEQLSIELILNTHGHFDHAGANAAIKKTTNATLIIHSLDAEMLGQLSTDAGMFGLSSDNSPPPDKLVEDGDKLTLGNLSIDILHTPGHTPGGISFLVEEAVFTGDTLFAGSIGRTDLPGGDFQALEQSIRTKLYTLEDKIQVYPGHMGPTTISDEKRFNGFVRP